MTLPNWLELGGHLSRSPELRQLWLELLHTYGPAAASEHRHLDHRPVVHDLTFEEVQDLLGTIPSAPEILEDAWCNVAVGAAPDVLIQMIRTGLPGHTLAGKIDPSGRTVALPAYADMALIANPRASCDLLAPLVLEGVLVEADIKGLRPRAYEINGASYRFGHDSSMLALARTLRQHLHEDPGAWRLFFELWDGQQPVREVAETVTATL